MLFRSTSYGIVKFRTSRKLRFVRHRYIKAILWHMAVFAVEFPSLIGEVINIENFNSSVLSRCRVVYFRFEVDRWLSCVSLDAGTSKLFFDVWQFLSWNFSVLLARSLTKKISVAQFCCNIALIRQTNPEIEVSSCSSMTTLSFHVETI